jgi:hypothetical protein
MAAARQEDDKRGDGRDDESADQRLTPPDLGFFEDPIGDECAARDDGTPEGALEDEDRAVPPVAVGRGER